MAQFQSTFHNGGYAVRVVYSVNSQDTANNSSNVTVEAHLVSLKSSYSINASATKHGSLVINGTTYSFSFNATISGLQDKKLYTTTVTIPHNSDGTKSFSISCSLGIEVTLSGTKYNTVSTSGTVNLPTIPRTTPVSTSGTAKFGATITITHTRPSTAFTITLRYTCGSASGTIITKQATNSTSWTVPKDLQSQIPKSTSIPITIYCDTYSGDTLIGTTYTSYTCSIADDCNPSLTTLSCSNPDTGGTTFYQGVSKLRAEVGYNQAYSSPIEKFVMTVDGQTITNYGYIIWSGVLQNSGAKDVTVTITDGRGRTATKTWSNAFTVTAYSAPKINSFTCKRMALDEDGNLVISNLGTKGYFSYDISWHSSSTNKVRKFYYKPNASSSWTTISLSNDSQTDYNFNNSLASGSGYDLKLEISDQVTTVSQTIQMPYLFPLINLSADGTSIAFGKEANAANKFMVSMNASFNYHTDLWTANVASTLTANSLSTTYDVTAGRNLIATNNITVPKMIYSPPLYDSTGNGQVINTGSDSQTLYVGNPKIKLNLESVQNIQANLNGTVYEVITSRKYKQATWLWSGTFNSTGSYLTLTGGANYSAIILYSTIGNEDSMVSQIVPWNIYNAGSLWIRVNGAAAGQFIKYRLTTSGSDVIVYFAGSSASGSKLQYIYGIC